MGNHSDSIIALRKQHRQQIALLMERIDKIISERNRLQNAVMKRDEVIFKYRAWFRDHEYLVTEKPIGTPLIHSTPIEPK